MKPDLFALAVVAAEKAYAPYSQCRVGCALETESGNVYSGCNVENASYGLTVCAERGAIFQAVAREGPAMKVARLAVVCPGHEFPPCGACRQVLAEFSLPGGVTQITFLQGGKPVIRTVQELLPEAFQLPGRPV
ncbi:MAG TPA: cytidine deaminase [Prosthecobacter sp.]